MSARTLRHRMLRVPGLLLLIAGSGTAVAGYQQEEATPGAASIAPAPEQFAEREIDLVPPAWLDTPAPSPSIGREPILEEARHREVVPVALDDQPTTRIANYRGRSVAPARVPYFDDFEHRIVGAEWRVDGTTRGELSTFAGPFGTEPQFLDIETTDQLGYLVEFDLFLLEPGDAGCTFEIEADGVVMYQESFAALAALAQPEGPGQVPVIRGARMGFIATGPVTELTFISLGDGGQQWGIDNVRIEVDPSVMLSEMGEEAAGGGAGVANPRQHKSGSHRKPGAKVRGNRGGRPGSGGLTPPDLTDLIEDPVEEPSVDDSPVTEPSTPGTPTMPDRPTPPQPPTQGTTPEDPVDPDVPAPGAAFVMLLGGAMRLRRRARPAAEL